MQTTICFAMPSLTGPFKRLRTRRSEKNLDVITGNSETSEI